MIQGAYIVIQSTQPPYSSSAAIDALEAAMAATNIGLKVVFIFMGEGVYQLLEKQDGAVISHKSTLKKLSVLPLFDIETIYAQSTALHTYEVVIPERILSIKEASDKEIVSVCQQAQHVLVF